MIPLRSLFEITLHAILVNMEDIFPLDHALPAEVSELVFGHLEQHAVAPLTDQHLIHLMSDLSQLTLIGRHDTQFRVTSQGLSDSLPLHASNLLSLTIDMDGCEDAASLVTDQLMIDLGSACPNLEEFSLVSCNSVTDHGAIGFLTPLLNQLECLSFKYCYGLGDDTLTKGIAQCSILQFLSIYGTTCSDYAVRKMIKGSKDHLRHLNISMVHIEEYVTFEVISQSCPHLEQLFVNSHSSLVDDEMLEMFNESCPNITHLGLVECHQLEGKTLANFVNLLHLDLTGVRYLTSRDLSTILVTLLPQLEYLSLADINDISDSSFTSVIDMMEDKDSPIDDIPLRYLDMSWAEDVSDNVFIPLFKRCTSLQHLILRNAGCMTDVSLMELASVCSSLVTLNVARSNELTEKSVIALTKSCFETLRNLDVSWSQSINDEVLLDICMSAEHLQKLNIAGCKMVSNDGVIPISWSLPDLQELDLIYVNSVTDERYDELMHSCPGLMLVTYYGEVWVPREKRKEIEVNQ